MTKSSAAKANVAGKISVKLIRSFIGRDQVVRGTLSALGLRKIGDCQTFSATPQVLGMIRRVQQIVQVEAK